MIGPELVPLIKPLISQVKGQIIGNFSPNQSGDDQTSDGLSSNGMNLAQMLANVGSMFTQGSQPPAPASNPSTAEPRARRTPRYNE